MSLPCKPSRRKASLGKTCSQSLPGRMRPGWSAAMLFASLFLVAAPCLAESLITEDWTAQTVGDTAGNLNQWRQSGSKADENSISIAEIEGKKLLEIRQNSQERWAFLGIASKENIAWNNVLKISFDAAFHQEGEAEGGRKASIVVAVLGGGPSGYQIVIEPGNLHIQRIDPYRPNPDNPGNPSFTVIGREAPGEQVLMSDDLQHYDLVLTKSGDNMKIELFVDNAPAPVAIGEDSPATNLPEDSKLTLGLQHPGWLRIGNVVVSGD